ncbi:MAG: ATP-binding protein [Muribaculaceae bacterium]|nr:ATP-binding protein [Muribaculaceae bacterium]
MQFSFDLEPKGYLKKRESANLEYKQNFQRGDNLLKYLKTLVGMANNKGGMIMFGIQDSPHIPLGMANNRFHEVDPKEIDTRFRDYFAPVVKWRTEIIEKDFGDGEKKSFGFLIVEEAEEKPVVCKKSKDNILREGAIYYRYRGETKEIEYPELKLLLDKEREKERILWIKHIQKIAMVGPRQINILDRYNGEISYGDKRVLIDKSLIDQLNFIQEGHFTEKEGEGLPTLKLIGTIDGLIDVNDSIIDTNAVYPLTTKELQEQLGLNFYQMQAIIYALDLKNKPKRHTEIKHGEKANPIHKYSQSCADVIKSIFEKQGKDSFLNDCIKRYKAFVASKPKKKRKRK